MSIVSRESTEYDKSSSPNLKVAFSLNITV